MEQKTRKILVPSAGICNITPDAICEDNELQDCVGMTFNNNAMRPIQDFINTGIKVEGKELIDIHLLSNAKNYIFYGSSEIEPVVKDNLYEDGSGPSGGEDYDPDSEPQKRIKVAVGLRWTETELVVVLERAISIDVTVTAKFNYNYLEKGDWDTEAGDWAWTRVTGTRTIDITVPKDSLFSFLPVKGVTEITDYTLSYNNDPDADVFWILNVTLVSKYTQQELSRNAKVASSGESKPSTEPDADYSKSYPAIFSYNSDTNELKHLNSFYSKVRNITSVGKTLVVSTEKDIHYFLWREHSMEYTYLGTTIPVPNVRMALYDEESSYTGGTTNLPVATYSSKSEEISELLGKPLDLNGIYAAEKDAFHDTAVGTYHACLNYHKRKNLFSHPFFACVAVELYDGSYVKISNPSLFFPCINPGYFIMEASADGEQCWMYSVERGCSLRYILRTDYTEWRDIVNNVCIFVTPQVSVYDTNENSQTAFFPNKTYTPVEKIKWDGIFCANKSDLQQYHTSEGSYRFLKERDQKDIIKELSNTSTYFLFAELGLSPSVMGESKGSKGCFYNDIQTWEDASAKAMPETLYNIATQTRLLKNDYFSHCPISAGYMESFNRRLNITDIKRGFYEGFFNFECYQGFSYVVKKYIIEVTIKTDAGIKTVVKNVQTSDIYFKNMWFYYPDPRANHVRILYVPDGSEYGEVILDAELKEHTGLNGAYYIGDELPDGEEHIDPELSDNKILTSSITKNDTPESLTNHIYQSDVDNPYIFYADGDVTVGKGNIIGMAALTTALSQDMYKVATTIVFTTQGIWALQVNSEGVYTNVPPPFSREVCNNADSITMVDNGVFFTTERGLMLIDDNGIRCVSEQLNGKNTMLNSYDFIGFLRTCRMAYDYKGNLLHLYSTKPSAFHWVYNIKSGTITRCNNSITPVNIINDYPDTVIQNADSELYSIIERKNINDDTNRYNASFVTRPLKFERSLDMKSIREILHIMDINGTLKLTMECSNDLKEWITISSLNGRGYKFIRFKYEFEDLLATDTYSGTALSYTVSETNKLR